MGNTQYDGNALKRLVAKNGVTEALRVLSSPDLPEAIKENLAKEFYFVGGYPNVELISSLA